MAVIAIDLGGTKSAAAIFNEQGETLIKQTDQLEKRKGKEVAGLMIDQINHLFAATKENRTSISSIGISVPGIAYAKTGKVWAPNIPGWDDYPLLDELQNEFARKKIKIKIDSDRACYILGEIWKGNAKNCRDAIFLAVGTGIGAGILVNDQIVRGANDIAGAIGWMGLNKPFDKKYIPCGDFECNASGEGLVKVAKELIASGKFNQSVLATTDQLSARNIFDGYDNNDPIARMVIQNAIEYWGMAIANLVSLFNPEKIILGGGVFGQALKFLDAIHDEAKKWAQPVSIQHVQLVGSALGSDAGLYGAGYLALKQ